MMEVLSEGMKLLVTEDFDFEYREETKKVASFGNSGKNQILMQESETDFLNRIFNQECEPFDWYLDGTTRTCCHGEHEFEHPGKSLLKHFRKYATSHFLGRKKGKILQRQKWYYCWAMVEILMEQIKLVVAEVNYLELEKNYTQ